MNNYSITYSHLGCCGNLQISAKYVMDNLVMCENRVHTHSHRAYSTENILNVKELAIHFSPVLLTVFSDLYLRNDAPPLRVAAQEALHHHITALPVGTHHAMLETPYFHFNY